MDPSVGTGYGWRSGSELQDIRVIAVDVFGTTVDWRTGVAQQAARVFADRGARLDAEAFADAWRDRYLPSLDQVNRGELEWMYLDALHRRSLDDLLVELGVADALDKAARRELVHAWHRLPPWPDAVDGLARLGNRFTVAALSNGGFALLTNLVKAARLPFDCILSAELAGRYKPDPAVYLTAVRLLDVRPAEVVMVAAHRWDVDGARAAGLRTAFVERPLEKGPSGGADRAAEVVADLKAEGFADLAEQLGCGGSPQS